MLSFKLDLEPPPLTRANKNETHSGRFQARKAADGLLASPVHKTTNYNNDLTSNHEICYNSYSSSPQVS